MSHIYAPVVVSHVAVRRRAGFVVLPKYDLRWLLQAISASRSSRSSLNDIRKIWIAASITDLSQVPPVLLQMLQS